MSMQLINSASGHFLAYLDGGTGSMLVQAALAGVLSIAFMAKTQWRRVCAVIAKRAHHTTDKHV